MSSGLSSSSRESVASDTSDGEDDGFFRGSLAGADVRANEGHGQLSGSTNTTPSNSTPTSNAAKTRRCSHAAMKEIADYDICFAKGLGEPLAKSECGTKTRGIEVMSSRAVQKELGWFGAI